MYKSFQVNNFRCFKELEVNDLARVNLVAGLNNVGKTALLEAMFLHCGAYNPGLLMQLYAFRGIEVVRVGLGPSAGPAWRSFFFDFDPHNELELIGKLKGRKPRRTLHLRIVREPDELKAIGEPAEVRAEGEQVAMPSSETAQVLELIYREGSREGKYHLIADAKGVRTVPIPPPPAVFAIFVSDRIRVSAESAAERYGTLQVNGKAHVVIEALRILEPRLQRLEMVLTAGKPVLHGDIGLKELVPLPLMGGGMVSLARMITDLANAPGGAVFIDEIDNGLHHTIMEDIWRAVRGAAAEFNTQVFATTHSRECIAAAHRVFSEVESYDFRLLRLDSSKQGIRCTTYGKEALQGAIEAGLEMR